MFSESRGSSNGSWRLAEETKARRFAKKYLYDFGMVFPARFVPAALAAALLIIAGLSVQVSQPVQASQTDPRFPDGPGKDALFKVCNGCHGPESAVAQLKTREEWSKTLDDMAAAGAQGTDEEWNQLLEYLDTNFSLILVNKADAKHLAKTLDVPQATAELIVKYRDEHGPIAAIADLKKIPGLDAAKVEARKDRFVF